MLALLITVSAGRFPGRCLIRPNPEMARWAVLVQLYLHWLQKGSNPPEEPGASVTPCATDIHVRTSTVEGVSQPLGTPGPAVGTTTS